VLILDEPSAGLDPLNVIEIRDVLRRYSQGRVVLVSTHILPETRLLCDRVLVMSQGNLVYDGSPSEMSTLDARKFKIRVERAGADGVAPVVDEPGTTLIGCRGEGGRYEVVVETQGSGPLGGLVGTLSARGWLVVGVEPAGDALEDAFRRAVLSTRDEAAPGVEP
jgi:ABC-2 type transport system ATP-binding protein